MSVTTVCVCQCVAACYMTHFQWKSKGFPNAINIILILFGVLLCMSCAKIIEIFTQTQLGQRHILPYTAHGPHTTADDEMMCEVLACSVFCLTSMS